MKKSEETPFDAVDAGRVPATSNTATGLAKQDRDGTLPEEDDHDQTLSPTALAVKPDYLADAGAVKPVGEQKEEARFTTNGSIPAGMVASNSGWVPASAVTRDQDEAKRLVEQNYEDFSNSLANTSSRQTLSDDKINSMSGAELRAVAHDRGYEMSQAMGTRATRNAFRTLQAQDKTLDK